MKTNMSIEDQIAAAGSSFQPEFTDHKGARVLYGFSRTHIYNLAKEGCIRSVSLRKPGAVRGRRLFDCASIRAFLNANVEESGK
jgi:hypothetical protein